MAKQMTRSDLRAAARRRERKITQACGCCVPAQIRALYERCPVGHHVDHEIPLAIGGKHCLKNLQILSEPEHIKKTSDDASNIAAVRSVWRALGLANQ